MRIFQLSVSEQGRDYVIDLKWRRFKLVFPLHRAVVRYVVIGGPLGGVAWYLPRLLH